VNSTTRDVETLVALWLGRRLWSALVYEITSSPFKLLLLVTAVIVLTSAESGDPVAVWLIAVVATLGCMAANAISDFAKRPAIQSRPQWSLRGMFVVIACVGLILASLIQQSPFRIRFGLARSAIDSLADRATRGETIETPCWAGSFRIRQVELFPANEQTSNGLLKPDVARRVFFWTDWTSTGRSGFACGIEPKESRYWTQHRLDDQWWFVVED
jgi:hypothetical protein